MGTLDEPDCIKGVSVFFKERENLADNQLALAGSHQEYPKYSDGGSTKHGAGKSRSNQTESSWSFLVENRAAHPGFIPTQIQEIR